MKSVLLRTNDFDRRFKIWEPPLKEDAIAICDNKQLQDLLGVDLRLIKKYRDTGKLGFYKIGDKFWYPYHDVKKFLNSIYYPPFYKKE